MISLMIKVIDILLYFGTEKEATGGNYRDITLICSGLIYIKHLIFHKQNSITTRKTRLTSLFTKGYYFTQIQ